MLSAFDERLLKQLWAYGIDSVQYMAKPASGRNIYKQELHPLWQGLTDALFAEYTLLPKVISQADVHLRLQRAKPWVTSWLAARGIAYADIPPHYKQDFSITELDYLKAKNRLFIRPEDLPELERWYYEHQHEFAQNHSTNGHADEQNGEVK